jgi:hypothetical protein
MQMTGAEAIQQLKTIDAGDAGALAELGRRAAAEALDAPRAVIDVWLQGEQPQSERAGFAALQIRDVLVPAVLDAAPRQNPGGLATGLRVATEGYEKLRNRVLRMLAGRLADTGASPGGGGATPWRICDQAYVLIRRVLRTADARPAGFRPEAEFVKLDAVGRSEEIHRWRRWPAWTALLEADQ